MLGLPTVKMFSIIGHSLGGLYARYCIGVLYDRKFFEKYQACNFITLATPHLGSRRSPKGFINPIACMVTRTLFSRTGKQLMLEDVEEGEGIPLLAQMADTNSSFFKALVLFKTRTVFANVANDVQVPYPTAAIMPRNPYATEWPEINGKFVILNNEKLETFVRSLSEDELYSKDPKKHFLRVMLKNLHQLKWDRVDILIKSVFIHERVVVKRKWLGDEGERSVIQLLVERFLATATD